VKAVKKLIQTNHWRYAMKKLVLFLLSGAFFLLTLNCGSEKNVEYDISKDASQLDMDHAGAVFENEHVRLIEVQLQMAEKQPVHHGLPRLIYALTPYTIKYTSDQMEEKETVLEAGTAHWHTADEHSVENIGETLAHYLIFEFKK